MFRILTENANPGKIKNILVTLGLDYTIYPAQGSWHGIVENSLIIEFDNATRADVERAAMSIKMQNSQEAVLLQELPTVSWLV